jgi:hypothetical protein
MLVNDYKLYPGCGNAVHAHKEVSRMAMNTFTLRNVGAVSCGVAAY